MRARVLLLSLGLFASAVPATAWALPPSVPPSPPAACGSDVPEASFGDVPRDSAHAQAIDCAVWWSIGRGVDPVAFSPAGEVTRGQMASFLARTVRRSGGALPASPPNGFGGDESSPHHYSINRLAQVGIVQGAGGLFAPDAPVTRAQMAAFLVRGYEQRTGDRLAAGPDAFSDDGASVHEASINKAAAAGLVKGREEGRYFPDAPVLRAQMASFVTRLLDAVVRAEQVTITPATLRRASRLETFDDCEPLLGHLKERAVEEIAGHGWTSGFSFGFSAGTGAQSGALASGDSAGGASGTNTQEGDVDEADIVKTDGRTIWSVLEGRLRAVDVSDGPPRLVGTLQLPPGFGHELLVHGDRALITSIEMREWEREGGAPPPGTNPWEPPSGMVTWVDLSDPADMRIDGTLRVDGHPAASRMVGGIARVVLRTPPPTLGFVPPDFSNEQEYAAATVANRLVVEASTAAEWLPRFRLDRHGTTTEGTLYGCDELRRPPEDSGLSTVNVLTLDPTTPSAPTGATGVLGNAENVYASAQGLYVTTSRWTDPGHAPLSEMAPTTEIHAFSLTDPTTATYRGSGKVDGVVLNQFALSEHEGYLRVATTSGPMWEPPDAQGTSESSVTVMAHTEAGLTQFGRVGGLGVGERIHSVRFLGDMGYVVTFRQTDPLYTLDLSRPEEPRVVGELKIPGYSAYLHPVGEGLLLGVGQDADDQGRTLGAQASLFDVSDPAQPRRLHQITFGANSSTDVEWDHRAFLHWPATGTTVLPLSRWSYDEATGQHDVFLGAVGLTADPAAGFQQLGEISHGKPDVNAPQGDPEPWPAVLRSVVVDGTVYTLSARGLKGNDLHSFADVSWVPFPRG